MAARTLHDVARISGLSIATISKYLNGVYVKPENEKKIVAAIKECNYNVNFFAKVLKTKCSMTIGVLIPNISSSFYSSIVSKVEKILSDKGYTLFISGYFNDEIQENLKFRSLISRKVDAILVAPEKLNKDSLALASSCEIPVLFFDTRLSDVDIGSVETDNFEACVKVMTNLLSKGFERIVVLLPNTIYFTTNERWRGCMSAISDLKAENRVSFFNTSGDSLGTYECVMSLLKGENVPDAIFALSSGTFLGALMAVSETGLKIPNDIAFIGYDNRQISKIYTPNISLVFQPIDEIAQKICERLENLILGEDDKGHSIVCSQITYTESVESKKNND